MCVYVVASDPWEVLRRGFLPHARGVHTADGLCAAGGTFGTAGESQNAPWDWHVGFWGSFWRRSDPPCWKGRRGDGAVERATANTANFMQYGGRRCNAEETVMITALPARLLSSTSRERRWKEVRPHYSSHPRFRAAHHDEAAVR
ncbi:hypothetical protein TcCL_Unassigned03312 [Trypanosoma cruzi]|nr:hypothetical protein TcCL_Unassigned03312 [Trypanosoma cruzi]